MTFWEVFAAVLLAQFVWAFALYLNRYIEDRYSKKEK